MNFVIFVHGFLGSAKSFHQLPSRVKNARVLMYEYSTRGSNSDRVLELLDFAKEHVSPADSIAFLGHSMGGILCADAARALSADGFLVVGVLGLDSPFFSVAPHAAHSKLSPIISAFFPSADSQPKEVSQPKSTISFWSAAMAVTAAVAVGVATTHPTVKSQISKYLPQAQSYISSHLDFLSPIVDPASMYARLDYLSSAPFNFKCIYLITKSAGKSMTFIISPPNKYSSYFIALEVVDANVEDEVDSHMNMFNPDAIGVPLFEQLVEYVLAFVSESFANRHKK